MTWFKYACTSRTRRGLCSFLAPLTLAITFLQTPASAVGEPEVTPGAKGAVGTALLGAELVLVVEAAIGVKPWWGYAIGGGLGAVGGAVGGVFIDKAGNPQVSSGLLVGGMLLAVPTTIAVLNATRYKPPSNPEVDSARAKEAEERFYASKFEPVPALLAIAPKSASLRVPAVEVRPVYTALEEKVLAQRNQASVRVPVFSLSF